MYTSFTVKNFRGFHDLTVQPLGRVNLIAGMNNVGKTALLEALFLHLGPGNPQLPLTVGLLRGVQRLPADPAEMWGWLFPGRRLDQQIELISQSDDGIQRSLTIRLLEAETSHIVPAGNGTSASTEGVTAVTTASAPPELLLEYQDSSGHSGTSRAFVTSDGLTLDSATLPPVPPGIFLTTHSRNPGEDAERFSNLVRVGREDEVLPVMKVLEPRLRRLAVLVTGGVPMINGDIGVGQLVPVPLMGHGMGRLLSIVLAIASAPRGTVLIDEIENGLHHSVLAEVWTAIGLAARQTDVQVFATTHSWECIRAAHTAFEASDSYDFRLHRLERIDHTIQSTTYDQEALGAALDFGLETR